MNISSNNIGFKAGLNNKILFQEQFINPTKLESSLLNKNNIQAKFNSNKPLALANKYCLDIFNAIFKKYHIELAFPPFILGYERKNLIDPTQTVNFCIPDTQAVLKNDYPFPGRTIFFKNINTLQEIDFFTELNYKNKKSSSPYFLAPFIHEWIHSLHLDYIFSKFGYGGNCNYLKKTYPPTNTIKTGFSLLQELSVKTLSPQENQIVYDVLGEYSTESKNQYLEIISEAFTKCICDSLKNEQLNKDPLEILKKEPKEFLNILQKVYNFN